MNPQRIKWLSLWGGPFAAALMWFWLQSQGWQSDASWAGAITLWCAIWWIFEPIPIPVTSLIPLAGFPIVGVLDAGAIAASYGHPIILLLVGGAMMSKAMEKCGIHRRIALLMIRAFGTQSSRRLVLGFMAAAGFLSMWISNTATTLMLLPVAMAVLERQSDSRLTVALLLGIAYGASIGGLATPIGTPPNLIMISVYQEVTGEAITFLQWMVIALPVVLCLLPVAALWITRGMGQTQGIVMQPLAPVSVAEWRVLAVFVVVIAAWMTLKNPMGGWSQWFGLPYANYASVAFLAVVVLCVLSDGQGGRLLDWPAATSIHWGVMILFAGGIAIAKAFASTGLSEALGQSLSSMVQWPLFWVILILCIAVTFLTEVTSNTATTTLLMPILAAAAMASDIDPALLMVPAALSASCAFMLPVATAPNAIVIASESVRVKDMARAGFGLNILGALLISVLLFLHRPF